MEFEKKYRTGILWQDYQHKKFMNLLNEFSRQRSDKTEHKNISNFIAFVTMHLHEHFSLEEEYMKEFNYPDIDIHIQEHKKFILQLKEFRKENSNPSIEDVRRALRNVENQIKDHILNNDKKLGEFILSQEKI